MLLEKTHQSASRGGTTFHCSESLSSKQYARRIGREWDGCCNRLWRNDLW